jgi:hypothetical protein
MTNLFVVRSVWAWRTKWVARASSMAITKRAPARVTSCKCKCHPWLNENNKKKPVPVQGGKTIFPIGESRTPKCHTENRRTAIVWRAIEVARNPIVGPNLPSSPSVRPGIPKKKKNVLIKPAAAIVDVRRLVLSSPSHLNGRFRFLEERRRAENKKRPKSNRIESNAHS